MATHTITLQGCAPTPLARYLKGLGILRVLSEQSLEPVAGHWIRGQFVLTTKLESAELLTFFLNRYVPTPLVVPWSGSDFFGVKRNIGPTTYQKCPTSSKVIEAVLASNTSRLGEYRAALEATLAAMEAAEVKEKKSIEGNGGPQRQAKSALLQVLRNRLPDSAVAWIDAAAVIESSSPTFNPLLGGGGGSDGNSHFSDNFMQSLWMALPDFDHQRTKVTMAVGGVPFNSRAALSESIFGTIESGTRISDLSPVLFDSTRVGGPNQTAGFEAKSGSNPWDFILMLEGSLFFAGALGRKLGDTREPSARFPFVFNSSPVGPGASYLGESSGRELWLPIWNRPTTARELKSVFAEGRVERHGRMARAGTDAFVAIAQHGVDRGINAFQRTGLFKGRIGGDNYFTAVDQGSYKCHRNEAVDLVKDVDPWMDRLRFAAKSDRCPNSVCNRVVEVDRSIAALALDGGGRRVQELLISLGRLERALASSSHWTQGEALSFRPIQGLRPAWLSHFERTSVESSLAVALAGMSSKHNNETHWLRQNLEAVKPKGQFSGAPLEWNPTPGNDVVWHDGDLTDAFNAILARRMIRVEKSGARGWPDWSPRTATLDDITQFIEGRTDDALLADLLWGLTLIDWEKVVRIERGGRQGAEGSTDPWKHAGGDPHRAVPSSFYALLRLCFQRPNNENRAIPLAPAIHLRAARGQGREASELAARRLRGSGYAPLVSSVPVSGEPARRAAAALLFPINSCDFDLLERTVLHESQLTNL